MERVAVVDGDRASSVARIADLHFYIAFNPELYAFALYEGSTTWFAYTRAYARAFMLSLASRAGPVFQFVDTASGRHRLHPNRMTNQIKYVLIF